MFRTFNKIIISVVLIGIWSMSANAFQLFGANGTSQTETVTALRPDTDSVSDLTNDNPLDFGASAKVAPDEGEGMSIWIPGLGVVGKMPKLDFGLEMLYGAQNTPKEAPHTAQELEEFESDFAIKGTIKRKF